MPLNSLHWAPLNPGITIKQKPYNSLKRFHPERLFFRGYDLYASYTFIVRNFWKVTANHSTKSKHAKLQRLPKEPSGSTSVCHSRRSLLEPPQPQAKNSLGGLPSAAGPGEDGPTASPRLPDSPPGFGGTAGVTFLWSHALKPRLGRWRQGQRTRWKHPSSLLPSVYPADPLLPALPPHLPSEGQPSTARGPEGKRPRPPPRQTSHPPRPHDPKRRAAR